MNPKAALRADQRARRRMREIDSLADQAATIFEHDRRPPPFWALVLRLAANKLEKGFK